MKKFVRVMDGIKSNAGGFEYKLDEINISDNWNPNEIEPDKMGGFNFGSEDKILRWLHRDDTIYDVIIPEDAEIILCNAEKGVWRANRIIVTNPRIITDEIVMELYKETTLSNKVIAQCLQTKTYGWDINFQRERTKREIEIFIDTMRIIIADNKEIGATNFFEENNEYVVGLVLIHPDYQRKGIATKIINDYINIARNNNKSIRLSTYRYNPAKKLYERLGFKQ